MTWIDISALICQSLFTYLLNHLIFHLNGKFKFLSVLFISTDYISVFILYLSHRMESVFPHVYWVSEITPLETD